MFGGRGGGGVLLVGVLVAGLALGGVRVLRVGPGGGAGPVVVVAVLLVVVLLLLREVEGVLGLGG